MVSYSRAPSPVGLRSIHTRWQVAATCRHGRAQQQIASCILEYFCENLCSATEFCRSNMVQKIKSDRICVTCRCNKILLQRQRFFHKISPVRTKWFVSTMCCHNMLLQLVARLVRTEWSVAMTRCCNLSPSVYRPVSVGTLFSFTKILELYSFWKECLQWVTLSALDLG